MGVGIRNMLGDDRTGRLNSLLMTPQNQEQYQLTALRQEIFSYHASPQSLHTFSLQRKTRSVNTCNRFAHAFPHSTLPLPDSSTSAMSESVSSTFRLFSSLPSASSSTSEEVEIPALSSPVAALLAAAMVFEDELRSSRGGIQNTEPFLSGLRTWRSEASSTSDEAAEVAMTESLEVDPRVVMGEEVEWVGFRPEARGVSSEGDSSGMVTMVDGVVGMRLATRGSMKRRPLGVVGVRDPRLLTGSRGETENELRGVTGSGGSLEKVKRAGVGVAVALLLLRRRERIES